MSGRTCIQGREKINEEKIMAKSELKQIQNSIDGLDERFCAKLDKIEETLYKNNEKTAINSSKLDKLNGYEKVVSQNSADITWLKKLTYTLMGLLIGLAVRLLI